VANQLLATHENNLQSLIVQITRGSVGRFV